MTIGYGEDRSTKKFNLKLRYVKTPDIDSIVIDYDWFVKKIGFLFVMAN